MGSVVTIVIPCYNQAKYLEETLQSLFDQTFSKWKCIIVNDGSLDDSLAVANELSLNDSRITIINQENHGLSAARNAGIEKSNSEYILPLDADDKISSNYLEVCLQHFKNNSEVKLVYGKSSKFDQVNEVWALQMYNYQNLLFGNMIYCTAMFKKESWLKVGGYDSSMIYGYEDWEFWINILDDKSTVVKDDSIQFYYRIKKESMFNSMTTEQVELMRRYVYLKHFEKYGSYFKDPISIYNNYNLLKLELDKLLKRPDIFIKSYIKNILGK